MVVGDDTALVDDDGPVADRLDFLHDVGGEKDHLVFAHLTDEGADFLQLIGVEARGWLVEDKHLGVVDESLGESDALTVALGELRYLLVSLWGETSELYDLFDPLARFFDVIDARGKQKELAYIHLEIEWIVLGQIADDTTDGDGVVVDAVAANGHVAFGRREIAGDDFHQRGLARTVGAEETDYLAFGDRERDVVESQLRTIALANIID